MSRARPVIRRGRVAILSALLSGCPEHPQEQEDACPIGEVLDSETASCVPERCGTGYWGLLERDGDTVHVAPWGDEDGDGSEERPVASIQQGADLAGEEGGGLVAVAAGVYEERLDLDGGHDGVQIAGRCAEMATIDAGEAEAPGVMVGDGDLGLRAVTVTGGDPGVWVERTQTLHRPRLVMEQVAIVPSNSLGLLVASLGASVEARDCRISNARPLDDVAVWGALVEDAATLVGERLRLEDLRGYAIVARDAETRVELRETTIRGTLAGADEDYGWAAIALDDQARLLAWDLLLEANEGLGVFAKNGARADLTRATIRDGGRDSGTALLGGIVVRSSAVLDAGDLLLEGNMGPGLNLADGARADLLNATIRGASPDLDDQYGWGVNVGSGARLAAEGLLLESNRGTGVAVMGGSATLHGAVVRDTRSPMESMASFGIMLEDGGTLEASDLLLDSNREQGLWIATGSSAVLDTATIRDTEPIDDGTMGWGIRVLDDATLVARNLLLERNADVGLSLSGTSLVTLDDAIVRGTQPTSSGTFGRGIDVQGGASLVARGLLLEDNHEIGLSVFGVATADLRQSVIRDTQPLPSGMFGRGINVEGGGRLVAEGLLLDGNRDMGLAAGGTSTTVELENVTVRGTRPIADGRFGRGIAAERGARLDASGLVVADNCDVGLFASDQGTIVGIQDALVSSTASGMDGASGFGVLLQDGAVLDAEGIQVQDSEGPGIYCVSGATMEASDISLVGNGFAGAVVLDADIALRHASVSGSVPNPSEGGGVGLFAWDAWGGVGIEVEDVAFADIPGPAVYLRGEGTYVVRGCSVGEGGGTARLPGGVLAIEGVGAWREVGDTGHFLGLLLQGNHFAGLPGNALLLDASSATLDVDPETGTANTFADLGGDALVWQSCAASDPPVVLDGSIPEPSCLNPPWSLGPPLEYRLWLAETVPIE